MKTIVTLLVLGIVGLSVRWFLGMRNKYLPLFDDAHLFGELPERLVRLKEAALLHPGEDLVGSSDSRVAMTSAGLGILYTTQSLETGVLNHLSLSHRGGPIAFAFASRCAFFLLSFLGVSPEDAEVAHSPGGVLHLGFLVAPEEVDAFESRELTIPGEDARRVLQESAAAWKDQLLEEQRVLKGELDLIARFGGAT